jgi:signal transduction histidine kinase
MTDDRSRASPTGDATGVVLETAESQATERRRRTRRRSERLERVSQALAEAASGPAIAQLIASQTTDAVGSCSVALGLLTDDEATFEVVVHTGVPADVAAQWRSFPNAGALPFPHVARTRSPLFLDRAGYGTLFPSIADQFSAYGFHGSAILPLMASGRLLGALSFEFAEPHAFADPEREFLLTIANQAAQALDRARLLESARQARQAAEQAQRAQANLLAVMSHELRTPLNTISGYIDLMLAEVGGPMPELYAHYAERMRSAQKYLVGLIDNVLRFARAEAGQVSYTIATHSAAQLLHTLEQLVAPQVSARRLQLIIEPVEPELLLRADLDKVIQILLNLLANAIKYTEPNGRITVSGRRAGSVVQIHVADTGRGIPAEALERIFEPFVKIEPPPAQENESLGLGLAISRDLARAMTGELAATSRLGQGSCFTLSLPAAGRGGHLGPVGPLCIL